MLVRDPVAYRWHFFPRDGDRHWSSFKMVLRDAVEWAGGAAASVPDALPKARMPGFNKRLAVHPYTEHPSEGEVVRQVVAYAWLDSYFLRCGQFRKGLIEAEKAYEGLVTWPMGLRPELTLWGEAVCLAAEVEEGLNEAALRQAAGACCTSFATSIEDEQLLTGGSRVPFGYFAVVPDSLRDILMILYTSSKAGVLEQVPDRALHSWILSRVKVRHCLSRFQSSTQPAALTHEQAIERLLRESLSPSRSMRWLEQRSYDLSRELIGLTNQISQMEEDLQVIQVAVSNVDRLLSASVWGGASRVELAPLLYDPIALEAEQLEWEVRHFRIPHQSTTAMLEHLGAVAELRRGQWERWIALLLFGTIVLGVLQAFQEDLKEYTWESRILVAVCGFLLLSALAWGLQYLPFPGKRQQTVHSNNPS